MLRVGNTLIENNIDNVKLWQMYLPTTIPTAKNYEIFRIKGQ